jgi:hypothetical protein
MNTHSAGSVSLDTASEGGLLACSGVGSVQRNRASAAPTASPTATEGLVPMQPERTALIQSVLDAIQALGKNEAIFLPGDRVVARSHTGKLRYGYYFGGWARCADIPADVTEYLTNALDHRQMGYFAGRYARELAYIKPVAGRIEGRYFIAERTRAT